MARSSMKESGFQDRLKKEIETIFPGSMVLKLDPTNKQGIPDLLVLYKDHWAALECQKNSKASFQPNQQFYISKMNDMSYSSVIYPENKTEVLHELQQAFLT